MTKKTPPPAGFLYVTKDIYLHADITKSSVQAFYTSGLSTCQAFSMWNDKGFLLTHIAGDKYDQYEQIIAQLVKVFTNHYEKPTGYGHAYVFEESFESNTFKKALQQNNIKVKYSVHANSVIALKDGLIPNKKEYSAAYFDVGKVEEDV